MSLAGHYDGSRALTSPRSLKACQMCGVEPAELLLSSKRNVPVAGVPAIIVKERLEHHERQRLQMLDLVNVMYRQLLQDETERSVQRGARSDVSDRESSRKDANQQIVTSRSVPRDRDRRSATVSPASVVEQQPLSVNQQPLPTSSTPSATMERVKTVRDRWEQAEQQRNRKAYLASLKKRNKILEISQQKQEETEIHLLERRTVEELRSLELAQRARELEEADAMESQRRMREKNLKAAAAIAKVQRSQAEAARRQREAIDSTMSHARDMKEIVERVRIQTCEAREQKRIHKREHCTSNQQLIAAQRTSKNEDRIAHVAMLRREQEQLAQAAAAERQRKEMARKQHRDALELEKQIVAEVRREEAQDRFAWVIRTKKALQFSQCK